MDDEFYQQRSVDRFDGNVLIFYQKKVNGDDTTGPVGVVARSVRRLYTTTVSRQVDWIWARRSE
jgi:hypothetical protein